jgi:hypothetical protein
MLRSTVVLALFLSVSASATPVVGPELPIATGPWKTHPFGASVATDGDTAFAIWAASNACYSPCTQLFGTPLDRNGAPLTPSGILLSREFGSGISMVWNGRNYVAIAYAFGTNKLASFLIARDGTLLREPVVIAQDIADARLYAGGNEVLLSGSDARGRVVAFLDADARPAPRVRLSDKNFSADTLYPVTFIHDGTNWIGVAMRASCGVRCTLTATRIRIRAQGLAVDEKPLFEATTVGPFALVRGGDRILIGWSVESAGYAMMGLDGTLLVEPVIYDSMSLDRKEGPSYDSARAAWDGRQFALTWNHFNERVTTSPTQYDYRVVRINADGTARDKEPFRRPGNGPTLTPAGTRHFVSYNGLQVIETLDALTDLQPGAPRAQSATVQNDLVLGRGDGATLALFSEEGRPLMRVLAADGSQTPVVAAPLETRDYPLASIVWNGAGWGIAWRTIKYQQSAAVSYRVLLQRFDRVGAPVDTAPIVVFEEPMVRDIRDPVALAFDGQNYFVAWTAISERVMGVRIAGSSGIPLDATPFPVSNAQSGQRPDVKAWWTGSDYLVVFHDNPNIYEVGSNRPSVKVPHHFRATRITREGQIAEPLFPLLSSQPGDPGNEGYYGRGRMDAASNGRELLLTWSITARGNEGDCSYAQRFTLDWAPVDREPRTILCGTSHANAPGVTRALWDGAKWWVFSSSIGREEKTTLAPLDDLSAAIVLTGDGDLSDHGDAVVTPYGFLVGYDRLTPEAGWVDRVYLRSIIAAPRARAVRR